MNASQIFSKAHVIAKSTREMFVSYRGAFSNALRTVYANLRAAVKPIAEKVKVIWSESYGFEDETEYSFSEFERKAKNIANENGSESGYDKTKVVVTFSNGDEYACRLDLSSDCDTCFTDHMKSVVEYAQTERGLMFYGESIANFFNTYRLA